MPALIPVVDNLDAVPEPARTFYVQKDGKFHLDLNGAPAGFVPAADLAAANGRVVEFRDNNIALKKTVDELTPRVAAFEGIDPEAAKSAIAKVTDLGKQGVKETGDLKVLIDAAIAPFKTQLEAQANQTATERKRADDSAMRSAVTEKFLKAGGKAKAIEYIIGQAQNVFQVQDGSVKAKPNQFSTAKPGDPLGIDEWIAGLTKDNDFAFEGSGGGGAQGGARQGSGTVQLKPGQIELRDPTPKQLGEHASDIKAGKVKVVYST